MAGKRKCFCSLCGETHYDAPCPSPNDIIRETGIIREDWDDTRLGNSKPSDFEPDLDSIDMPDEERPIEGNIQ